MMRKAILRMAGVFLFTVAACDFSSAQVDESTGTIRGTVYDANNAVISGATVKVTNPATGVVRTTTTRADGTYSLPQLNPATYQIQATAQGFQTERANQVTLNVGQVVTLDGHLLVGSVDQVIEVQGDVTPLIDTQQTQQANTLNENQIQYLPNASRSLLTEVFTLPGVGSTAGAQAQNTGSFFFSTTQVSVGASNGRGNLVTVNSGEDDYGTGAVRFFVPVDAIQEAQVNRNGYQAEFGFASGAAINYITKSGTNHLHGDVFGTFDNRNTNSQNYLQRLNNVGTPFAQNIFAGASAGGRIFKDKLFFFGSYEFQKSDFSTTFNILNQPSLQPFSGTLSDTSCFSATPSNPNTTPTQGCFFQALANSPAAQAFDPADANKARAFINNTMHSPENLSGPNPFYPLTDPNLAQLTGRDNGTFNTPFRNHKLTTRFDYQPSNTNTVTSAFSLAHGSNFLQTTAPDGAQNPTRDYEALVDWVHIFNPNLFNKVLFQYAYNRFDQETPNSANLPEILIDGIRGPFGSLGHNAFSSYFATENRYEFGDSLALTKGHHDAKFGFSYRPANYKINNPNYRQGEFDFFGGFPITGSPLEIGFSGLNDPKLATLAKFGGFCPVNVQTCIPSSVALTAPQLFDMSVPFSFEGTSGSGLWSGWANYAGVYAQDSWKIKSNLTLSYGGRVDFDAEPTPLKTYKSFSPRVGLAWSPYHDQRTVVRLGGGLFVAPTNFLEPLFTNLYGPLTGTNNYLTQTAINITQPGGSFGAYVPIVSLYQSTLGPNHVGLSSPTVAQETGVGLTPGLSGRLVNTLDPHYTTQKVYQASASVAQQIGADYSLELSYIFYRGNHLPSPLLLGYNPSPTVVDQVVGPTYLQDPVSAKQIPNGQDIDYASNGNSIYHGGTVSLNRRYTHHVQFQANYTWSRSIDDATDFNQAFASYRPNGTSVQQEKGVSDFNRTNVFVASAVYNTVGTKYHTRLITTALSNVTIGPIFSASSGAPFDVDISTPFSNFTPLGNLTARPYHAQRNSGQGPGFMAFDLKVTKGFALNRDNTRRIYVSMDSTNLFNRDNFSSVYNFFPSSVDNFTPATATTPARQATTQGPFGPDKQFVNFATGPFNLHGYKPTTTASNQPLAFNQEAPARQIQLGARFEF